MSDKELVKRLLDFDKVTVGDARDAALRIEALTAERAKAVEALRDLTNAFAKKVDVDQTRWKTPYEHPLSAYDRAVAFLKGENP